MLLVLSLFAALRTTVNLQNRTGFWFYGYAAANERDLCHPLRRNAATTMKEAETTAWDCGLYLSI